MLYHALALALQSLPCCPTKTYCLRPRGRPGIRRQFSAMAHSSSAFWGVTNQVTAAFCKGTLLPRFLLATTLHMSLFICRQHCCCFAELTGSAYSLMSSYTQFCMATFPSERQLLHLIYLGFPPQAWSTSIREPCLCSRALLKNSKQVYEIYSLLHSADFHLKLLWKCIFSYSI